MQNGHHMGVRFIMLSDPGRRTVHSRCHSHLIAVCPTGCASVSAAFASTLMTVAVIPSAITIAVMGRAMIAVAVAIMGPFAIRGQAC